MAGLSRNKAKALAALLVSSSIAEAAKMCNLGERTVRRYLEDDDFRQELRAMQDQAVGAAAAALAGLTGDAIETLRGVLTDGDASHSVKVRAALGILQERRRTVELDDLVQQVREIREMLGDNG